MKQGSSSIDLDRLRRDLVGSDGSDGMLSLYLSMAKDTGASASPNSAAMMMFIAVVDACLVGLSDEARPLLQLTQQQLRDAIRQERLPEDIGQQAMLYEHAALFTWMAEGREAADLSARALDCYEAFVRAAYLEKGVDADTLTMDAYMRFALQAGQGSRAARFFETACPRESAKAAIGKIGTTERAVAYAVAMSIPGAGESVDKLLHRSMEKWLAGGLRRAAVCWLKFAHWRAGGPASPADVIRLATRYLPGVSS